MRTSDTLVSLIWFDGWFIPTGILCDYGGYLKKCGVVVMRAARKTIKLAIILVGQLHRSHSE
jgi:hypothetical protein